MLTDKELQNWCVRNKKSKKTIKVIANVRSSPPARRVESNFHNVCGRFPSKKMGHTIQFESRTLELAFIYMCEYDPNVLEFWDQPPRYSSFYTYKDRKRGVHCTSDFFLILRDRAGWVECKTEQRLENLAEKPTRVYYKDEDGLWHYQPGENYARQFDLFFEVRSSAQIDPTLIRNMHFLEDYFDEKDES